MSAARATTQDDLHDLFREIILEHYRHPRNRGNALDAPDIAAHGVNSSCGDSVNLRAVVDGAGIVTAIEWDGQGCAISQASVSMMTRAVWGKPLAEVERIIEAFRAFLKSEDVPPDIRLGELEAMSGVRQFPVRVRCALLGWHTLKDGIAEYLRTRGGG